MFSCHLNRILPVHHALPLLLETQKSPTLTCVEMCRLTMLLCCGVDCQIAAAGNHHHAGPGQHQLHPMVQQSCQILLVPWALSRLS